MAVPLGYTLLFGLPIVFWTGILTGIFVFSAGIVMILTWHTRIKFPVKVHHTLAIAGLALAVVHVLLALTIYL